MSQEYQNDRRKVQEHVENDRREANYEYEKKNFFQVTWKEIITATLSLLILGAVTFVFSNFNTRLERAELSNIKQQDSINKVEILMEAELREAIKNITRELEKRTNDFDDNSDAIRSLERSVARLEALLEN